MRCFDLRADKNFALVMSHLMHRTLCASLLRTVQIGLLRLKHTPESYEADDCPKESTIKKQMGAEWSKLHPNVQRRFAVEPAVAEHVFYRGMMETVECSFVGKVFAQLARLIANPLTPYEAKNIRMDVMLYRKTGFAGVYWRRTYYYVGREPYTVTSVKRHDNHGRLTECVGGGFGMELSLSAQEGNLVFRSTGYFWALGKFRLPLPHLLTPGETTVVHEDLGNGTFRFTITINHLCLGRTFYQTGIFEEA